MGSTYQTLLSCPRGQKSSPGKIFLELQGMPNELLFNLDALFICLLSEMDFFWLFRLGYMTDISQRE